MRTTRHRPILAFATAALLALPGTFQAEQVDATAPAATAYVPVVPCRVTDTRINPGVPLAAGQHLVVHVAGQCGLPAQATGVLLSLTAVDTTGQGFASVWDGQTATVPTSNLNWGAAGYRIAGTAMSKMSAAGDVTVYVSSQTHFLVSVLGGYVPAASSTSGRYVPVTPRRLLDTRQTSRPAPGAPVNVPTPPEVPASASAVALNITATGTVGSDFVIAYAAGGAVSTASIVNADAAGQTRAAFAVIPLGATGVTLVSSTGSHLVVDLAGYYTGAADTDSSVGLFVPVAPIRLTDTRLSGPQMYPGGVRVWPTPASIGSGAAAVMAGVISVQSNKPGYATTFAAGTTQPPVSNLNWDRAWSPVTNLATPAVSTAGLAVYALSGTQVVVDIFGYFTGTPTAVAATGDQNPVPVPDQSGAGTAGGCLLSPVAINSSGLYVNSIAADAQHTQVVVLSMTAGWRGPVVLVGDSITRQSAQETAIVLRQRGYGPICVDGLVSRSIAYSTYADPDGVDTAARIRSSDPVWASPSTRWAVALGTNDIAFSGSSAVAAAGFQQQMMAAIGPVTQPVPWVNVGTLLGGSRPASEAAWNGALSGRPVIDWKAQLQPSWILSDKVHLTAAGIAARAQIVGNGI